MNNKIKKTQTILLGAILTALIIPIGMNQAFAESENISDKIDSLIEKYNNLETKRHVVLDKLKNPDLTDEKKSKLEAKYDRIVQKMERIEVKAEKLALQETEYNPTTPKDDFQTAAITTGSSISAGSSHTTCDDWSNSSYNLAIGDINTGLDTINWGYDVTDHKSAGWFSPFCTDVYFEEITFNTRNNSKGQSCTMTENNVTGGNVIQTCNCGIESGNLLSWSVQTTYEPISGSNTSGNDNWNGLHRVA